MKRIILTSVILLISIVGFAQTKGISYQAVIIDPNPIEIPGKDIVSQPYVSKDVWIRFGIYSGITLQYEELQKTKTDEYGLVNLVIGNGTNTGKAGSFSSINWNGTPKSLITNVSFNQGVRYAEVSNQPLNYVPFAYYAESAGKLDAILPLNQGGTAATNATDARSNFGLNKVDNTADLDKPVSTATLDLLGTKENVANKSSNIIADSASFVKYPSVKAIKDYIDARTATSNLANQANNANLAAKATALETPRTINGVAFDGTANITIPVGVTPADASASTKGILQLVGDLSGTAAAPTIATGAVTNSKIGDAAISSIKLADGSVTNAKIVTVSGSKIIGDISGNSATSTLAVKATALETTRTINGIAFDGTSNITIPVGVTPVDASAFIKGILQLAGDLSGTAAAPTIATGAVTNSKIVDAAISSAKLADGSVTDAKIVTISGSKIIGDISGNSATSTFATNSLLSGNITATLNNTINSLPNLATVGTVTSGTISLSTVLKTSNTISAGTVIYPNFHGTANQVLSTTGSGTLTWTTPIDYTFDPTNLSNRISANTVSITANTFSIGLKVNQSAVGVANGVASLDATGKVPSSQLPQVTLNSTNVVGSEFDMLHLTGITVGSIAIRADISKNFVLSDADPTVLSNWVELLTPAAPVQSVNGYTGSVNLTKLDFGLNNVDNTSDALKPISNLTQSALNLKLDANKVGVANGTASLNASGKIPTEQIPAISFSSVKVLGSQSAMLALSSAVIGSVVIRTDVNKNFVLSASDPAVLANWVELLTPSAPVQTVNGYTGSVNISKSDLGLSNVDNTSDANKPISTLTQTALNLKANTSDVASAIALKSNIASPSFTGTPLAPTASAGTNTTQIATTEYVTTAVSTILRQARQQISASAGQVSFTLSQIPAGNSQVYMYINGIRTNNNAYSWSQNTVTYSSANNNNYTLLLNDRIQFDYNY